MADENKNQVEETTEEIEETKEKKVENKEPEKKYSDEQVDEIIKEKKAKWQKQQDEKIKELEEARKLEKMNEDEKLKYELDKYKRELEEYKQRENQSAMAKVAKNMLIEQGFNISDDLVNNLITDEAETTKENVKDFAGMLKDLVEKEVNERLKGKSPEVKKTGVKSSQGQRSEILGIKDAVKRREAMLNHPELFN
ncbi:MAG: DUF4355 domain-containing protein [Anaerococcus vaginalis]|uniref:DUF4355 domain-containing protein n=1 Tax=Anaerococcus vaginalis TaxID=33037 RepID=UPI001D244C48|nr:DUF4355 domain-containing protein [Anaerococcus vaginalis]MBS4889431.1 DUF4355 domain-containing protein [Anaerococcus vaginalis]